MQQKSFQRKLGFDRFDEFGYFKFVKKNVGNKFKDLEKIEKIIEKICSDFGKIEKLNLE